MLLLSRHIVEVSLIPEVQADLILIEAFLENVFGLRQLVRGRGLQTLVDGRERVVNVAVASPLGLILVLHVAALDFRGPLSKPIEQLFDQSATVFAEAPVIYGREYGRLIHEFLDHYDPGVIDLAALISLYLPLGINDHLVPDLDLLAELTQLHLLDLELQLRLLLLPLELQVLHKDNVFFQDVPQELTWQLLVPRLLPLPWELVSAFHQRYHLSVVVIKLCLEFT